MVDCFPLLDASRYSIAGEVGRGGLGRVLNAHDRVLDRDVALKELHDSDHGVRARFVREALITARLQHPSIIPIYEAGRWRDGAPFYAMKLVAGRPFSTAIANAKTLQERLALLPVLLAVADAVAYAHSHRIVHRDLKPANVLVGDFGETVVIDWGLAKDLSVDDRDALDAGPYRASNQDQTMAGALFGTPAYMAPEQAAGEDVDERADVYALGAILYHVLSGEGPHDGATLAEVLSNIIAGKVKSTGEIPGVPLDLAAIIAKASRREAKERYATAKEFAEDLRRFQTGQLVASHRYTRRELFRRFYRRHRIPFLAIGAAIVGLSVVGTGAVWRVIDERDRADAEAVVAREAQAQSELRADQLLLQQAKTRVTSNPTETVGMLKPLVRKHWPEVRSIATAAHVAGVAWSLPCPRNVDSLELSRNGKAALVAGDGKIILYDLVRREHRVLVTTGARSLVRLGDRERKVVASIDRRLVVFDVKSGSKESEVLLPSKVHDFDVVGHVIYLIDMDQKFWQLEIGAVTPSEIVVGEELSLRPVSLGRRLVPSPDERWIALSGTNHLLLYDRTQPTQAPVQVALGEMIDLEWAADGRSFAAVVSRGLDTSLFQVSVAEIPLVTHRFNLGSSSHVALRGGVAYSMDSSGVVPVTRTNDSPRKTLVGRRVDLQTFEGGVVAASSEQLLVVGDNGERLLTVPARIRRLAARSSSPFVVAVAEERILVWNLGELLPRRINSDLVRFESFVGNDELITVPFDDKPALRVDLRTGATRELRHMQRTIAASRDGGALVWFNVDDADLHVEGRPLLSLGSVQGGRVVFADRQLVFSRDDASGTIEAIDLQTSQRKVLVSRNAKVVWLATNQTGPWVVAMFADDTLWRANLMTETQSIVQLVQFNATLARKAVAHDGTVLLVQTGERTIHAWRPTGAFERHVELPDALNRLEIVGANRAFAIGGGRVYMLGLDKPDWFALGLDVPGLDPSIASDTGLMVYVDQASVNLLDPFTSFKWTLATSANIQFSAPKISADGRRVMARANTASGTSTLVWHLDGPDSESETARWLETMTNAVIDPASGKVDWVDRVSP